MDASRAVAVASTLLSDTQRDEYKQKIRDEYEALRKLHLNKKSENVIISIEEARANKFNFDWKSYVRPSLRCLAHEI